MGREGLRKEAAEMIREMGLDADEVDGLEECEAITNLITPEVFELIPDEEIKETILWLNREHAAINSRIRETIAELTVRLFGEAGGPGRVRRYHQLEQVCNRLSEGDLESAEEDGRIREIIDTVRHIHDNQMERLIKLVKESYRR